MPQLPEPKNSVTIPTRRPPTNLIEVARPFWAILKRLPQWIRQKAEAVLDDDRSLYVGIVLLVLITAFRFYYSRSQTAAVFVETPETAKMVDDLQSGGSIARINEARMRYVNCVGIEGKSPDECDQALRQEFSENNLPLSAAQTLLDEIHSN